MDLIKPYVMTNDVISLINGCVNKQKFDTEKLIGYLPTHEIITKDIFNVFHVENRFVRSIQDTYLNFFVDIPRETFIKRIPIYFYDSNNDNTRCTINDLFQSCINYLNYIHSGKLNVNYLISQIEELYNKLEYVIYNRNINLKNLLDYLLNQGGIEHLYYVFNYWFEYIMLCEANNRIFPFNVLTSLNNERIKNQMPPYIFSPMVKHVNIENYETVKINGLFPTEENGGIIFKWTGLWNENINELSSSTTNNIELINGQFRVTKINQPILLNEVRISVNPNSKVLISKHIIVNGELTPVWEEIYLGLNVIEFDPKILVMIREERRKSQKDMAENLGVNLRTYQRMEAGESMPGALDLIKIMYYLGVANHEVFIKKRTIVDPNYQIFESRKK